MRRTLPLALFASLSIGCSGSDATSPPPPPPPPPPPAAVATITVENVPAEMEIGKSAVATATPRSAQGAALAGRTITWASSNDAIAAVTLSGTIHANGSGTATITATSEGRSASANVKVDTRLAFLTAIVESVRSSFDLPALTGAIVTRSGGVVGHAATGRRRSSQATPVTLNDLWHIGSNLKAITAHVAAIAVAEGEISWTTTLADAYPELSGSMRTEYRNVTLRQLLGHTGRIIPNVPDNALAGGGSLTTQRATLTAWATSLAPSGGVGQFNYSNVGYMIAANMVERAIGTSWEDVMQSRLLGPLGITAFGWGPAPVNVTQNPVGHERLANAWTEFPGADNPPFLSSAGRSHWSMDAWGKVVQDIMKADQGQSALVPQAVARINTTSQSSDNYGSGWFLVSGGWAGSRGVQHDGSNNLNYARVQVALDAGVAVMGVTNSHDQGSNRSNDAMVQLTTRLWNYYSAHVN